MARPLAQALADVGLTVWYDEFSLSLGDSLRQSIERGIAGSRHGIVILSPNFFTKRWPLAELNGLFTIELSSDKTIIPIWHDIDRDEIVKQSPIIADRVAVRTSLGLDTVLEKILDVIEPNKIHCSKAQRLVSAEPRTFQIGSGNWSVKTPVTISNRSGHSVHAVWVKVAIRAGSGTSNDIQVEIPDTSGLKGGHGSRPVSGDCVMLDCVDEESREAVVVIFHTIPPQSERGMIVFGRGVGENNVVIELCDFNEEPAEFMETTGKIAQIIQPPESITIKGIRFKVQK